MRGHCSRLVYAFCLLLPACVPAQETAPATQNPPAPAVQGLSPAVAALPPATAAVPFGEISGTVKSGNIPLPGVTVTASNTLTGKKYVTSTEVDGGFKLEVGTKGRYVVRAELSAFAPVTQEVLINAENRNGRADLAMMLMSRVQKEEQQQQKQQAQQLAAGGRQGGLQQLALSGGGNMAAGPTDAASLASSGLPNAGLAAEGTTESVAVSGAMGRNDQPMFDPGEMQDRIADMRDQMARQGGNGNVFTQSLGGGGFGGAGFSGATFGGGPGGPMVFVMAGPGGFGGARGARGFNINKPHGSIFYSYGGSALDATPYSLNGISTDKADYSQHRFGITIGGPLNIPHIYKGGTKTFLFGSYIGTRGNNPYDVFSTVPTLAERSGNFSASSTQIINPTTGLPFANNTISSINPVAAQLLQFIPMPNLPGSRRNFHFVSANQSDTDTVIARFNHSFGADQGMFGMTGPGGQRRQQRQQQRQQQNSGDQKKTTTHWSQSINGGISYTNVRTDLLNPFPNLGGKLAVNNFNGNFSHNAIKGFFLNNLRFNYNRSTSNTLNNFTNVNNIEGQLGIHGISQNPSDFGLPVLIFSPEFSSLQDIAAQFRTTQNYTLSDSMSLTRGKHSWSWGGDFRRQLIDVSNATNARGTFTFNGRATGIPFADFLLGFPTQTSIQFGAENYHFHANSFNLFVQDNWRAGKSLTLNLGLRYEFTPPYTEANNKLVNLDIAPGFAAVAPVQPGQRGPLTGRDYPSTLVSPDRNNFAPRVGIAWKPFSKTVVRSGYGINYNLGQYTQMATLLGFQPPFAVTQTVTAATATSLTLQNPFAAATPAVTNNYAVDPNYVLAYVQTWNLNVQQEVKGDLTVNIGYTGSKGTHLDIVRAPSLDNAALLAGAQPFKFESSNGSSILHAGSVRVRKRMRHGLSLGGTYTYSKSIDNASSIGGGAVVVAQNDLNLAAERGLSSFDQRHRFTADYYYDLPFGKDRKWLNKGTWAERMLGGYSFSGNLTIASGFPFSPQIFGSFSDLNRGANGSLRPDIVPGQSIDVSNPGLLQWFNTAAFVAPAGRFGDAGRDIIIGPGTISLDMSVGKTIQLKETQRLEVRLSATNVFNHANFAGVDTILGSPTFGQITSVGSMRKAQISTRYNF